MAPRFPVDPVFCNELERGSDFAFNETAGAFDERVSPSAPFYGEIRRGRLNRSHWPALRLNDT